MNIIITGASRGIGFECVKLLAQNSSNKILVLSRNEKNMKKLKEECEGLNENCHVSFHQFDLAEENVKEKASDIISNYFTNVDVLINNAGALLNKPALEISEKEALYIYKVNVFGVFGTIQATVPLMNKGAHILNIGSMGGFQGSAKFSGLSIYSSSKGALACLSECLAEELKENDIKVNCLALGAAQTEMLNEAFPGYEAPISAKEMAEFVTKFALENHKYINGKVIPVALSTP